VVKKKAGGGGGGGRQRQGAEVKIGAVTDIKLAAGAVANMMREGTPPKVLAISPTCVNAAVKTLALARRYLEEEGLELMATVDFPEFDESANSANVALHLSQKRKRTDLSTVAAQLQVSSSSEPSKVAGAVAGTARECADQPVKRLCVSCAGPAAMLVSLQAVYLARRYLEEDGLDLSVVPEFENVERGPSIVHLFTLVHKPNAAL